MGEYARFQGREIKIGTCEDMYYLRFDQRRLVEALSGNVNPKCVDDCLAIRFRFPWPDEDGTEPGGFKDYDRAISIGIAMPEGIDHGNVQFAAHAGYLCSLPCPEGPGPHPINPIHRNGFGGAVKLVRQKLLADGRVVPIMMCGGCGALWRMEDENEISDLAKAFRDEGDRKHKDSWHDGPNGEKLYCGRDFWYKISQRILEGTRLDTPMVEPMKFADHGPQHAEEPVITATGSESGMEVGKQKNRSSPRGLLRFSFANWK